MKKCPKCGRTSPPALVICPRCKTPFEVSVAGTSEGSRPSVSSRTEESSGRTINTKNVVTISALAVLILVSVIAYFIMRQPSPDTPSQPASRGTAVPSAQQQTQQSKSDASIAQVPAAASADVSAARDAFKQCIAAYKSGNREEVKRYVSSKDLSEMEQSGMFDMAMGMMAGLNIDEFTPTQEGNRMTFKKSDKQGDMTSSMSVHMVKEDGQWKMGK